MNDPTVKLACVLLRLDDLDGANSIVDAEIDQAAGRGNDKRLWQFRFVRAEITRLRGSAEEALKYLELRAFSDAPQAEDRESQAALRMHLGYYLGLTAAFSSAHAQLTEAEGMALAGGLQELQGEVLLRRAMIFFLQREYVASDGVYRAVLSLSEELGGWYFRGMALWGIGKNLMIQGHYENAKTWLDEALKVFETAGARLSTATVWGELGVCYLGLGNDEKALELFRNAAQADYESGALHNYKVTVANIGNVYLQRGNFFTALSYYDLGIAREIRDPLSVTKWTYNIRLAYAKIRSAVDEKRPKTA
jgi:tetratricopeptide (TPR) repeat protein